MSARNKAYIYLLVAVAIWGAAGPIIKYTLGTFDTLVFLSYRFFLSCLILIPILFATHPRIWQTLSKLNSHDWITLITSGLFATAIQLGFLFWGMSLTTSIDGTLLSSTSPILVAIAGVFFLHEHITKREKIGLTIAFVGTVIIISQSLFETGQLFSGTFIGNFLVMISNVCWVIEVILTKKLLRHNLSPLLLTTSAFFFGFIAIFITTIFTHSPYAIYLQLTTHNLLPHLGVFYMALISGALAYFLYNQAQKTVETGEANIFIYLQPLFATPLAYFWLKEPISLTFIVGAIVIATGVLISEVKFRK